jgi:hypothetical protein
MATPMKPVLTTALPMRIGKATGTGATVEEIAIAILSHL